MVRTKIRNLIPTALNANRLDVANALIERCEAIDIQVLSYVCMFNNYRMVDYLFEKIKQKSSADFNIVYDMSLVDLMVRSVEYIVNLINDNLDFASARELAKSLTYWLNNEISNNPVHKLITMLESFEDWADAGVNLDKFKDPIRKIVDLSNRFTNIECLDTNLLNKLAILALEHNEEVFMYMVDARYINASIFLKLHKDFILPYITKSSDVFAFLEKRLKTEDLTSLAETIFRTAIQSSQFDVISSLNKREVKLYGLCISTFEKLLIASMRGDFEIIKEIIFYCPHLVTKNDTKGYTALMLACKYGHYQVAKFLNEKGAKMWSVNSEGANALMFASAYDNEDIVKYLCANGFYGLLSSTLGINDAVIPGFEITPMTKFFSTSKINCKDMYGNTALHYAVQNGCLNIVEFLLRKGADHNIMNKSMETPIMLAKEYGYSKIIRLMEGLYSHTLTRKEGNVRGR